MIIKRTCNLNFQEKITQFLITDLINMCHVRIK